VVKSGELYKRAFTMAKRMGVRLERVSVIPFGRGRLTNAYGGSRGIAITDDYGHWLHGAHLDFVIGHELAHVQERHGQRKLLLVAAIFSGVAALTFAASRLSPFWQIPFKFVVVLLPVLAFYYVSRRFEFAADRIAVQSTGDVEAGIGALASTYRRTGVPPRCNSFDELFSTHLALWRRVNAVAAVGRVSPEYVSRVEQQFNDRVNELPTLKASSHSE
jgi:Zn-dependent protease with chaperone function